MNPIVGMTHPLLTGEAKEVSQHMYPSQENVRYMVEIAMNRGLLFVTAPQLGIDSNFFVACLEDGIYRAYVNPNFINDDDLGHVERLEKTPHGSETFAVSRPVSGTLYHMNDNGALVQTHLVNDAAANAHAACMYLQGKPPWVYEKLGDW